MGPSGSGTKPALRVLTMWLLEMNGDQKEGECAWKSTHWPGDEPIQPLTQLPHLFNEPGTVLAGAAGPTDVGDPCFPTPAAVGAHSWEEAEVNGK